MNAVAAVQGDAPPTLEQALIYLARGFSVIPLCGPDEPHNKPLDKRGKTPVVPWTPYQTRRATEAEIRGWFDNDKGYNIGIVTGAVSGLTVVDFDSPEAIELAKAQNFPRTPLVKTGKGFHAYCCYAEGHRNFQKRAGLPGIDLRAEGGYIVAPPSIHFTGKGYEWIKGRLLDEVELAEVPEWVIAESDADRTPIEDIFKGTQKGNRNEALARVAGSVIAKGYSYEDALQFCLTWNGRNVPPLPEKEIETTVKSIWQKHRRESAISHPCPDKESPAEGETTPQLNVVTIHELLSLTLPERESLLHPIILTQSLNMIHSWRGIGKTHVGLAMAFAVSSGGTFLKWYAPTPRGVLYIDGEMPACSLQERLADIAAASDKEPLPDFFRIITPDLQESGPMPDLSTTEGQALVDSMITPETALIIVDNISCLCRTGRENESESWLPVQGWALRHRACGRSIIFIHHSGKGGAQRGNSKKEDALDVVLDLQRPVDYEPTQGARFEVEIKKGRHLIGEDAESFEAQLTTGPNGFQVWIYKTVTQSTFDRVVVLANEGLNQTEIAKELDIHKSSVSRHWKHAEAAGLIKTEPKEKKLRSCTP